MVMVTERTWKNDIEGWWSHLHGERRWFEQRERKTSVDTRRVAPFLAERHAVEQMNVLSSVTG